jgi:hypothetical protein
MLMKGLGIETMSSISSTSSNWLQSITPGGNWVQSAVSSSSAGGADWMDAASSSDPVDAAANAFAAAEQNISSSLSANAVNNALTTLESQASGQSVNILT